MKYHHEENVQNYIGCRRDQQEIQGGFTVSHGAEQGRHRVVPVLEYRAQAVGPQIQDGKLIDFLRHVDQAAEDKGAATA